jgi:hypothetical protein
MNVEIGTEAVEILFWEYLFRIFDIVSLQCSIYLVVLLILRIGVDRQPSALFTQQQRVGGVPVQHVDTPTCPLYQQHHDAQ